MLVLTELQNEITSRGSPQQSSKCIEQADRPIRQRIAPPRVGQGESLRCVSPRVRCSSGCCGVLLYVVSVDAKICFAPVWLCTGFHASQLVRFLCVDIVHGKGNQHIFLTQAGLPGFSLARGRVLVITEDLQLRHFGSFTENSFPGGFWVVLGRGVEGGVEGSRCFGFPCFWPPGKMSFYRHTKILELLGASQLFSFWRFL